MALTNWNDILNKPNGIDEVPEIALTVEQLSASVLSISEDVGEIAGDVQEIALEISQLSASTLPYSSTQSTKQKIDEIVDSFVTLDDTGFTWDNSNKRFSKSLILTGYKAIIVNTTNGAAVMGAFYSSQNSMLYVYGFVPSTGESIGDTYHFSVLIIK